MPTRRGSLFLFRFQGVNVFVHWSWAVIAIWRVYGNLDSIGLASGNRNPVAYHIAWVLMLFLIVLMHEFGHALACKSVGGTADTIVLWPLGGVAYVNPPQRPGAMLWSIVAGPLVNVILLPVTIIPWLWSSSLHLGPVAADFVSDIALTNLVLLIFNMLPVYPLDGGKILWSLLWFIFGRGLSLVIAAGIGIAGTVGFLALAAYEQSLWTGALAVFMGMQSYQGIRVGRAMYRAERVPRHVEARCPSCRQSPPQAPIWQCPCGGAGFDTFQTGARCPHCGQGFAATACPYCGKASPMDDWYSTRGFPVASGRQTQQGQPR